MKKIRLEFENSNTATLAGLLELPEHSAEITDFCAACTVATTFCVPMNQSNMEALISDHRPTIYC